jgi:hypothetical protein
MHQLDKAHDTCRCTACQLSYSPMQECPKGAEELLSVQQPGRRWRGSNIPGAVNCSKMSGKGIWRLSEGRFRHLKVALVRLVTLPQPVIVPLRDDCENTWESSALSTRGTSLKASRFHRLTVHHDRCVFRRPSRPVNPATTARPEPQADRWLHGQRRLA